MTPDVYTRMSLEEQFKKKKMCIRTNLHVKTWFLELEILIIQKNSATYRTL